MKNLMVSQEDCFSFVIFLNAYFPHNANEINPAAFICECNHEYKTGQLILIIINEAFNWFTMDWSV